MTTRRLILIIGLITFLGLITAWQQIQTLRLGYQISEANQTKKQLLDEEKALEICVARLKSPGNLLARSVRMKVNLVYPEKWGLVDASKGDKIEPVRTAEQMAAKNQPTEDK
ncbi:hypothetical protein ES705_23087 [subsurface metagenome]